MDGCKISRNVSTSHNTSFQVNLFMFTMIIEAIIDLIVECVITLNVLPIIYQFYVHYMLANEFFS